MNDFVKLNKVKATSPTGSEVLVNLRNVARIDHHESGIGSHIDFTDEALEEHVIQTLDEIMDIAARASKED